jgi:hypothetical protein
MDAVRVEHFYAEALGIEIGKRGDVNDADGIRLGEPQYLVEALDKALVRLKKRAAKLPDSDGMKIWVENSIGDLGVAMLFIDKSKDKISGPACLQEWYLSAISLHLIAMYLGQHNL